MAQDTPEVTTAWEPSLWLLIPGVVALAVLFTFRLHVLGRGVRLGWRFTAPAGLLGAVAMFIGGLIGGGIGAGFRQGDGSMRDWVLVMAGTWIGWAAVTLLLLVTRAVQPTRRDTGSHRRATLAGACVMGCVGLAVFWPLTMAVNTLGSIVHVWVTGDSPETLAHGLLHELATSGPSSWSWSMVLLAAVVPPLLEEVLYRGLVQESIRRSSVGRARGAWRAVLLTSLLFTWMHMGSIEVYALPGLFVLSLGFGWASARTGRLAASMTMHMLFNVGNLLLAVPWITG
jgi:membrane protease YdiL (CAAX protease family)